MNYLFHLYLSGDDPEILTGNFMGDFVKGRLEGRYSERVRLGLMLHRGIDSFSHHDETFRRSRQRLSAEYGLYRGVLIDLFYDHFLVKEWDHWSGEPFSEYLGRVRRLVELHNLTLPVRLQQLVPIIFSELLPSYGEVEGIASALERMSSRIRRPNPLTGGAAELRRNYERLREDFREFMPKIRSFSAGYVAAGTEP